MGEGSGQEACASCLSAPSSLLTQNSGEVFEGIWNMTPIALKVLKTEQGSIPGTPVRDSLPSSRLFVTKPNVKTMRQEIKVSGNPVNLEPTSNLNIDMVPTSTSQYPS